MTADQLRSLRPALAALMTDFRVCFAREVTFEHWQCYVLGLLADLKRKSIEPIALANGMAVRTLQEFLATFVWDHQRANRLLRHRVVNRQGAEEGIGVLDSSGHAKQGAKTPGVQRQWCGETGKIDNCVVGQHLLYTNNDPQNAFSCMLASDLFLPESWAEDRERCREAGIPDDVVHRPKWRIGIDQVEEAIGDGVRFDWLTFDEEYGSVPAFWFELDRLGQRGIGEVRPNFSCWPTLPHYCSTQSAHAAKRVDNVCSHSPVFRNQEWYKLEVKDTTRGPAVWELKAGRVRLVDTSEGVSKPTDREYWLLVLRNPSTDEHKYFVSSAGGGANWKRMMHVAFARWHVEKWFERAKQETGFGAFEVRNYVSLIRHWLSSRMAMLFLAEQTERLRKKKSADHAGAGGGGDQRTGGDDLEPVLAFVR